MVRSYGTTHEANGNIGNEDLQEVNDSAPLLGDAAVSKVDEVDEGTGSIGSSVGNLANTVIGSGMFCRQISRQC